MVSNDVGFVTVILLDAETVLPAVVRDTNREFGNSI